jgi:hypothetical protein
MKILRRLGTLGMILSTISTVRRLVQQRRASRGDGSLFGDVKLPKTAVAPHFPEPLPPRM